MMLTSQTRTRAYVGHTPRQRLQTGIRAFCVLAVTLLIHLGATHWAQQQTVHAWDSLPEAEPAIVQVQLFKPPTPITIGTEKTAPQNTTGGTQASVSTETQSEALSAHPPADVPKPSDIPLEPDETLETTPLKPTPSTQIDHAVVAFPKYGRLTYDTLGGFGLVRIQAHTVTQWHVTHDRYEARSITTGPNGEALLNVTSSGRVLPSVGIAPQRYTEATQNQAPSVAEFLWDQNILRFTKTSRTTALIEGTQDRLSFQAQLALLAQAFTHRFVPGAIVAMPVASPRQIQIYDFHVTGWQAIQAQDGTIYDTLKLDRPMNPEHPDVRVEIWLAPNLNWLPVRVRITFASGYFGDSVLIEAQFDDQ